MASKKPTKKASPAPRTRTVAKVSPLKGMPVDEWVRTKTAGWQTKVIGAILKIVREAAPHATVAIKWSQPVFELNGPFAYVKPAKAHVTFGFWRGSELPDPSGLLTGGERMSHMKIVEGDALKSAALTKLVKEAVKMNAAKGDPTKR